MLAGSAFLLLVDFAFGPASARTTLELSLAGSAAAHLCLVLAETAGHRASEHVRAAVGEMTRGRLSRFFWPGVAGVAVALAAPVLGVAAAAFALIGLLAHEHAYVQAGQCVPLA